MSSNQTGSSPTWRDPAHPTAHDRFRHIFRDHWDVWCDLRLADEVPPHQRAYVCKTVERMILCHDPNGAYALYICPGCKYEQRYTVPEEVRKRNNRRARKERVEQRMERKQKQRESRRRR